MVKTIQAVKGIDAKIELFVEEFDIEASISILRKKMGFIGRRPKITSNGIFKSMGSGYLIATPNGNKTHLSCYFTSGRQLEALGKIIHKAEKKQAKLGR